MEKYEKTVSMEKFNQLKPRVEELYQAKHPDRAEWADWIYEGHVLPVAESAKKIAQEYGGNPELAAAAGLLHDVADAVMKRENPEHVQKSFEIARDFLRASHFTDEEIAIVVDDAIAKHSCRGDVRPETLEGKAMAAGDAVMHLQTDFYQHAETRRKASQTREEISAWALPKIDRDFQNKIAYPKLQNEVFSDYQKLRAYFA